MISIGLHDTWFVVRGCESGVLAWKATCCVNQGNRIVNFQVAKGKPKWTCLHITDLEGWLVYDLDVLPPCSCITKGPTGETLGIVARMRGQPMPLLRNAALHAFQGLICTRPDCTKLLKYLLECLICSVFVPIFYLHVFVVHSRLILLPFDTTSAISRTRGSTQGH